jgi:hypothetical protein
MTRKKVKVAAEIIRSVEQLESDRRQRLSRIRTQERELALLKQLPAAEYVNYDRLRQHTSAKLLQRTWKRVLDAREKFKKGKSIKTNVVSETKEQSGKHDDRS